jgi:hypothetical protein
MGTMGTPYKRYFRPAYSDSRMASPLNNVLVVDSTPTHTMPSARLLSTLLSADNLMLDANYTHLLPLFGQFIAHVFYTIIHFFFLFRHKYSYHQVEFWFDFHVY